MQLSWLWVRRAGSWSTYPRRILRWCLGMSSSLWMCDLLKRIGELKSDHHLSLIEVKGDTLMAGWVMCKEKGVRIMDELSLLLLSLIVAAILVPTVGLPVLMLFLMIILLKMYPFLTYILVFIVLILILWSYLGGRLLFLILFILFLLFLGAFWDGG